jgi:hypothetical protein
MVDIFVVVFVVVKVVQVVGVEYRAMISSKALLMPRFNNELHSDLRMPWV